MEKIKLNEYQNIFFFIWDNKDETIDKVNEYLKTTKGNNWSCGRCYDEDKKSNTSDTIFISENDGFGITNSFYYLGEYVIDFISSFWSLKKEEFDKGDFIEKWKQK